jgi:hypothetical protein
LPLSVDYLLADVAAGASYRMTFPHDGLQNVVGSHTIRFISEGYGKCLLRNGIGSKVSNARLRPMKTALLLNGAAAIALMTFANTHPISAAAVAALVIDDEDQSDGAHIGELTHTDVTCVGGWRGAGQTRGERCAGGEALAEAGEHFPLARLSNGRARSAA